ncbi:hypothetical protein E4U17_006919 [Claviceps sp. LM77 group G4]|nr:hypothetical protein E4U17_006919 [Claviceps sp. LM77 group G4]KAG6059681.1 hypothetical protein E4U33_007082 [Claviceps sp. LM78 group G4]KAG6071802.1 hypothetical protein E4U16_005868 [Claviceps sp. LM84 group G4]
MTILCLHGAYGSALHFETQLRPFKDAVEKRGLARFKWINGGHAATPPPGFDEYFGPGPLYRFIDFDGVSELDDILSRLREIPQGTTAEDAMRRLVGDRSSFKATAIQDTLDRLMMILDEDPEITGILGYSEGATVAASLILEEQRRYVEQGRARRIKNAIFFAGWPPVRLVGDTVECLLADECDTVIDIPTCHVVGCNDPYIDGAMALFSMCDEDSALLFDHGKGHTVPRDPRTLQELVSVVNEVWTSMEITIR